ncbi:MAG: tRNA (cytidine(34)-2'-O)-methyltransferase [Defluviitaleaceae bacterium]|nr:tRNA (cytidine(34)-2'-O)-methyltransferase [Defluviitaleaceae bacterium]
MNIVLHEPEIPHNTGAVGRTCLLTGARLHLIHPLGFFLDEKSLKRSGLDYWHKISVTEYENFDDFLRRNPCARLFFVETGGSKRYDQVVYDKDDFFVFGRETKGLPPSILERYPDQIITIPMKSDGRSLNLSVTVGIILYEALRQTGFGGLCL